VKAVRGQPPVFLWHGEADTIIPPAMSMVLSRWIPGAHLTIVPGEGPLSLPFRHFPVILHTLL
jgi:pimeloyl-ACP methyl ester carboxylesterase